MTPDVKSSHIFFLSILFWSNSNPNKASGGRLIPAVVFKKCIFSDRMRPCFFVTFNIIISHVFPENFIEILQVLQKI